MQACTHFHLLIIFVFMYGQVVCNHQSIASRVTASLLHATRLQGPGARASTSLWTPCHDSQSVVLSERCAVCWCVCKQNSLFLTSKRTKKLRFGSRLTRCSRHPPATVVCADVTGCVQRRLSAITQRLREVRWCLPLFDTRAWVHSFQRVHPQSTCSPPTTRPPATQPHASGAYIRQSRLDSMIGASRLLPTVHITKVLRV